MFPATQQPTANSPLVRKQQGLSLIEVMVGLAIGSIILLGVVSATLGLLSGDSIAASRLDGELRNTSMYVARDLARAGYRGDAAAAVEGGVAGYASPFDTLDVSTPGCVRYSYDANSNGVLDVNSSDERFAVLLSNKVLYSRAGGSDFTCDFGGASWVALTDPAIMDVTDFSVSLATTSTVIPGSTKSVRTRNLTFVLSGALKKPPNAPSRSITTTVKLQNDVIN